MPRERDGDTIDAGEIARRLGDPSLVLVDARTPNRWRGEPNPVDDPPGRIPGALNAPWAEPLPELPDGELVAYCGSGVTACVVLHRACAPGPRGEALSRLVERVVAARPAGRARARSVAEYVTVTSAVIVCVPGSIERREVRLAAANGIGVVACRLRRSTARRRG